jgi:predicted RecA/RadA family phage recombinase
MKNKIQDGKLLHMTVGAAIVAGDPVMVGYVAGVAQTSYSSADGKAVLDTEGVFDLSVQAANDAGNSAVAIGDKLYYDGTTTLSKKASGKFFGVALETVSTGTTSTINVLVTKTSLAQVPFVVFAAGIATVNDSPLAAAEFIPVTGILATDVVIVTMSVNGGAATILSAIAAASPAGITVTADKTFTGGDKINYVVYRAAV